MTSKTLRVAARFSFFVLMLAVVPGAWSAGIPIIDASKVKFAIEQEVKAQVHRLRKEALAKAEQLTGIEIAQAGQNHDEQIGANTAARLTETITDVHNLRSDATSAPYLAACATVSAARSSSASVNNQSLHLGRASSVAAFTRPDQNPEITSTVSEFFSSETPGRSPGKLRGDLRSQIRDWERDRFQRLDQAIVASAGDGLGLSRLFHDAVRDGATMERVAYLRAMLLGSGASQGFLEYLPNQYDANARSRDLVEEGMFQAVRSAKGLSAQMMNDQTSVVASAYLPVEGLVSAMADPERAEQLSVSSTNDARVMTDRAMLQRIALDLAVSLAAMLQEYRRNQVDLINLVLLAQEQDGLTLE